MAVRTRPTGLLVKASLILVLLLVLAAAVGVAHAAASSSPAPAEKVTLHIGMVQEPDNLNPFIGIQGIDYMFWHMNYDFLVGFDSKTLEPRPELATEWAGLRRRQGVDVHHPRGIHVAGRRAGDRA